MYLNAIISTCNQYLKNQQAISLFFFNYVSEIQCVSVFGQATF